MEKFAVIGMGRFGMRLAQLLAESGADVIAVDRNKSLVDEVADDVARAVCLNATDEEALRAQGIDKVDVAIVGIGSAFESAILTTVLLKQIGVPRVICRAASEVRAKILEKVGADDIVNPERESAERWRTQLMATNIMERIDLAEDFSLLQVAAPESFAGKSLGDLDVRKKFQVQVVAIRRSTQDTDADGLQRTRNVVISVPMADSVIKPGDVLLLIANDDAMKTFPAR